MCIDRVFSIFISSVLSPHPKSDELIIFTDSVYLCISIMANKLKKAHFPLKITLNGFLWGQKDHFNHFKMTSLWEEESGPVTPLH